MIDTTHCYAPGCASPRPEHAFLCNDCVRVLTQDVASVPALVADLELTLSRQDRLGADGGRRSAETALPYKIPASEALFLLGNTITTWCRHIAEERGLLLTSRPAVWLLANIQALAMSEGAGEAVDEIGYAVNQAMHVIDRPPSMLFAGPCREAGCIAYLYAMPAATTCECRECGAEHDVAERREWMIDAAAEQRVTATVALSWVRLLMDKGIPPSTWRSWIHRGRLAVVGVNADGRELFRFGQVRDLAIHYVARGAAA